MKTQRAFTLVELIIAMALLAIILVSFYPIIINTNKVNQHSKKTLHAEFLAEEHLEYWIHHSSENNQAAFFGIIEKSSFNYEQTKSDHKIIYFTTDKENGFLISATADINQDDQSIHQVRFKVESDNKLLYETETWLSYEK